MSAREEDVLIIGGGVIGVCAAYYLAEAGRSVTLLERGELCSGSSYGNAGLVAVDHAIPTAAPGALSQGLRWMLDPGSPFYIKPRLEPDLVRWLWRFRAACREAPMRRAIPLLLELGRSSLALYQTLHRQHKLDDGFRHEGRLILFRSEQGMAHGREELALLGEYGVQGELLGTEEVKARMPLVQDDIVGGIYFRGYAHLEPAAFVRELGRVLEMKGVGIRRGVEVLDFETAGPRIERVVTTRGVLHPREVVLAAGVWSAPLARRLGLYLPIQAAKGYSITARRPDAMPELPLSLGEAKVAVTPMAGYLRFSSTLELNGFDMSINARRVEATRRALRTYLAGMEGLEELELWRGLRPMTPDSLPIIGRSEMYTNLVVATGHGMLGVTQGPITGKLVADLVSDATPALDPTPFRIERFS
ncbi:MAG: FAD-dependent oxidoreductase [Caldilineae bacterium]|nr:MAG: FAD-dependent oxidoreductase [Caldilineae bacterium]